MQLTTIKGIYIPNDVLSAGRYACNKNCTIVTKLATITINAGILTLSGITFLSKAIIAFDAVKTTMVVIPIPKPFCNDDVTASVGHIPNIRTNVGFSFIIPLYRRSKHLFI